VQSSQEQCITLFYFMLSGPIPSFYNASFIDVVLSEIPFDSCFTWSRVAQEYHLSLEQEKLS
jgi:hypothetical protein